MDTMAKMTWAGEMGYDGAACDEPERELDCVRGMVAEVRRAKVEVERFVTRFHGIGRALGAAEKEAPPCGYSGELRELRKAIDELSKQVTSLASIG